MGVPNSESVDTQQLRNQHGGVKEGSSWDFEIKIKAKYLLAASGIVLVAAICMVDFDSSSGRRMQAQEYGPQYQMGEPYEGDQGQWQGGRRRMMYGSGMSYSSGYQAPTSMYGSAYGGMGGRSGYGRSGFGRSNSWSSGYGRSGHGSHGWGKKKYGVHKNKSFFSKMGKSMGFGGHHKKYGRSNTSYWRRRMGEEGDERFDDERADREERSPRRLEEGEENNENNNNEEQQGEDDRRRMGGETMSVDGDQAVPEN